MSTVEIWDRFSGELRAFIQRRVSDEHDAEDLLQDVFLKIHTRMHTLNNEEKLASWIYQIARNTITDYYRSQNHTIELQEGIAVDEDGEEEPIARLAVGVHEMIDTLPDIYRQPLLLSEISGMKQAEVAGQLGLSVSGAKSRIQRGRAMLKQSLLDCCHFEFDRRGSLIDYLPRQDCCEACSC